MNLSAKMGSLNVSKLYTVKRSVKLIEPLVLSRLFIILFGFFGGLQANAYVLTGVKLSAVSFISSDYENTDTKSFSFLGLTLRSVKAKDDIFRINLDTEYAIKNPILSSINPKEIYFNYKFDENSSWFFGRKLNNWSDVDQRWNLGLIQPQFRWNPLNVENQGLTGVFYEYKNSDFTLNLFASFMYLPDQGASYEIKEGQFESTNPYFTPPPQNINFQNTNVAIDYNIKKPSVAKVIFQPQFAAQIKTSSESVSLPGFYGAATVAYKPSNQLALGYNGVLVTDRVRVDVLPKTYYEKIGSLDVGYKSAAGSLGLSAIYDGPETPEYEPGYNYPIISASTSYGPYAKIELSPFEIELSGLIIQGEDVTDVGPQSDPERPSLTQKFLYRNAYQIQLNYRELLTEDLKLISSLQWRQAEGNLLKVLKWSNTLDIRGPLKFNLDIYLVDTSNEISYVNNYRNLDQVWAGATYEF